MYKRQGEEIPFAIDTLKLLQQEKHRLILWSVREGALLDEAVEWCKARGLSLIHIFPVFQINPSNILNQSSRCFEESLKELKEKGEVLCPGLFYPFDFISMQPVDGTRHRLLR